MTVFELDESGKWFDVDGGGRIQVRSMTFEKNKEIAKATRKKRVDFKKVDGTPARFESEEVNEDLANRLFWDFVIVAWENFLDSKGNEIPCTTDNKLLLISKSTKFVATVRDCLEQLAADDAEQAKAEEKNS
jgi:hypothetical protein